MTYGRDGRDGRCGRRGRRRAALVIALALTPAIAWAQDGGQVIPPEWWVRVLVGALGGAVSWAQAVIAASASASVQQARALLASVPK